MRTQRRSNRARWTHELDSELSDEDKENIGNDVMFTRIYSSVTEAGSNSHRQFQILDTVVQCTHLNVVAELNIETRAADQVVWKFPQTERRHTRQWWWSLVATRYIVCWRFTWPWKSVVSNNDGTSLADDAFKAVNSQEVGAHLRSDLHGKSGENMRFIFGRYQVRVWSDVSSQVRVGVAWLLHYCVDQQPENLWNQDVWSRRFERAQGRIDLCMWATRQLHHFCWKWGFRYHQCTCRGDQQSRQEVSVFSQLTSSTRSTIGSALVGAHLKVKFGEFSEAVLVFADFPGYTRFVLRRSKSCLQWCRKFSFSTSMSVHAESPESSASLLLPVLSVRAMWVVLLRTEMFMCS